MSFDVSAIRRQFPLLSETADGRPPVYLDNAATTQKPRAMLDAMQSFYEHDNANPHRGMHILAERATDAYEGAREAVAGFLNAATPEEIVFTKNATESINIVARGLGAAWKKGDAVILTRLEHHSNVVPWLILKEEKGIELRWVDMDKDGHLDLSSLDSLLTDGNAKLVTVTALSNVLGIRPPLEEITRRAHAAGAPVLLDAAQSVAHHPTDVQALDCDFLAFSAHKLYGPTGIGILYGKASPLSRLPPLLGGGMMIKEVCEERYVPADIPARFEGGTPPVAEAVGFAAAIRWLGQYAWKDIEAHERKLLALAQKELLTVPGLTILGPQDVTERSGSLSFTVDGIHPHDLTHLLGERGICLRAGQHCTEPLHRHLKLMATTRLSVALYNTEEEIRAVAPAIREIQKQLRGK
ncbi:MAG: SufS family cysteine desulfurase [Candidatus Peribacteraceae bacterium]|nr:SufS family cysteine desulfurase [Candidatus Peribacteraceae bacterium]